MVGQAKQRKLAGGKVKRNVKAKPAPLRIEGGVYAARVGTLCTFCPSVPAKYLASCNLGTVTLCEQCFQRAKVATANGYLNAANREKTESLERSLEYKKARLTVSGGGANGTGRNSR